MAGLKIFFLISVMGLLLSSAPGNQAYSQQVDESKIIPELKNRMYSVEIRGAHAFAAVTAGLIVLDISDPSAVKEAGIGYTTGATVSVTLSGSKAFMSVGPQGLSIFDISNPSVPKEIGKLNTKGAVMGTAVKGDLCFAADGTFGLIVFDVSDPAHPKEISHYDIEGTGDYYRNCAVGGDLIYAAVGFNGVKVFRIGGKKISKVSELKTRGEARFLAISDRELLVADGQAGLTIYDISNPETPKEIGFIGSKDFTRGVAMKGSFAYLADGNGGLRIIDVSDPKKPVEKGSAPSPASSNGVAVSENHAFLAADSAGLVIYDVSNPSAPVKIEKKKE